MDKLTDYELELFIQQVEQHEMLRAPTRLRDQPTLQAQMRFNKYNNWESKWLHREEDKYKERDAYWDGEEIPSNNWQISNILQELEQKMEGFLGGSVW